MREEHVRDESKRHLMRRVMRPSQFTVPNWASKPGIKMILNYEQASRIVREEGILPGRSPKGVSGAPTTAGKPRNTP